MDKETIKIIATMITACAAFFASLKIAWEIHQSTKQRKQDLAYKKVQIAKSLNDEMLDDNLGAKQALQMLDWSGGRIFELNEKVSYEINSDIIMRALRTQNLKFKPEEMYIRDCFDRLFYFMGIIEHQIDRELIDFEDISYPIDYYIKKMKNNDNYKIYTNYMKTYGNSKAIRFIERFK